MLGKAFKGSYFRAGRGLIGMSNVNCHGNESSIFDCQYVSPYGSNCDHSNDAGVTCYGNFRYYTKLKLNVIQLK